MYLNLKAARKEKGLSIAALSKASGVPVRTIENVERSHEAKASTLVKLAKGLAVSINDLFREEPHS